MLREHVGENGYRIDSAIPKDTFSENPATNVVVALHILEIHNVDGVDPTVQDFGLSRKYGLVVARVKCEEEHSPAVAGECRKDLNLAGSRCGRLFHEYVFSGTKCR